MEDYVEKLKTSYQSAIDNVGEQVLAKRFFDRFFETYPETLEFFKDSDMEYFRRWKMKIVFDFILDMLLHPNYAEDYLSTEVIRHQVYGLKDKEYYFTLVSCLYQAVKASVKAEHWDDETDSVWNDMILAFKGMVSQSCDTYL